MLIEKWMSRTVHSVKPLDSILHARKLMVEHRINQLPVTVDQRVVGIVTDRDLRDAFPSVFSQAEQALEPERPPGRRRRVQRAGEVRPEEITVDDVMTRKVLTLSPEDPVADAARLMRRERIGGVPIVAQGKLVGILTRSDVLGAFLALLSPIDGESFP